MSIRDVIKKSILESEMYNQTITLSTIMTIVVDLTIALLMGLVIYYIYKKYFKGVVYSRNYAITLVGMTVLTSMVTLAISTNIVISLGMVGALSIVRYRTAIKEPLDLLYMFWAITTGITVGASMYILAILGAVVVIGMIVLFSRNTNIKHSYVLVVHYHGDETGDQVLRLLGKNKYAVKSKTLRNEDTELTLQIESKNDNLTFTERIRELEQVKDVTLLEYNGEYHG